VRRWRAAAADPRWAARSIASIACDAGFGDRSHFNKMFERLYGATSSDVPGSFGRQ